MEKNPYQEGSPNKSKTVRDPAEVPVQTTLRIPWAYLNQLSDTAARRRVSLNTLILDTLQVVHPKEPSE